MYFGFPLSVDNLLLVDSPGVSSSVPSPRNSLRPFSPDQKFGKTATPLVNHAPRSMIHYPAEKRKSTERSI